MNLQNENKASMSTKRLTSNRLGMKAFLKGKNKKIGDLKVFVLPMKKKISRETANLRVDEMSIASEESHMETTLLSEEDVGISLLEIQPSTGNKEADQMNLDYRDDSLQECDGDISKEIFSDGEIQTVQLMLEKRRNNLEPPIEKNSQESNEIFETEMAAENFSFDKENSATNVETTKEFPNEVENSENSRDVNGKDVNSVEMELLACQRIMTWLGIRPEVFAQAALMHKGDVDKAVQWMLFPDSDRFC